ncbi:hypothetical protein Tsubulata_044438 [Turnera subulata]|uniref:F-box domain-containing protein n=1 Tax=Turnera subulata TaxID=218843 RepID=A0A9Q0JH86_9ROSI|nr:hypothetical protein Tsubulata_044438 [Turnera subulata]
MENNTTAQANKASADNLPHVILEDILSRLPALSILTCRRVCKTWCKVTKDQSFVNLQLKRSSDQPPSYVLHSKFLCELFFVGTEDTKARELCKNTLRIFRFMRIMSSCNGLLCIAPDILDGYPTVVSNPITEEHIVLPEADDGRYGFANQVGLGFDPITNKYKVASIFNVLENGNKKRCLCEIITLGENSWRKIDLPFEVLPLRMQGAAFWEGALHWICSGKEEETTCGLRKEVCILRLDITREEFCLISTRFSFFPGEDEEERSCMFQLLDLAGLLTLVVDVSGCISLSQFKRSETNGICEERFLSIGTYMRAEEPAKAWQYHLFGAVGPDKLLLRVCENRKGSLAPHKIVLYFPQEDRFSNLEISGIPLEFMATSFRPSFVSIQATSSADK